MLSNIRFPSGGASWQPDNTVSALAAATTADADLANLLGLGPRPPAREGACVTGLTRCGGPSGPASPAVVVETVALNPPALGRASRGGASAKKTASQKQKQKANLPKGGGLPLPFPSPEVPKSSRMDPYLVFLPPKTRSKKHSKKQPQKHAKKHPKMSPKWSRKSMKIAPRQNNKKQYDEELKMTPNLDPKLMKNSPGALSAVFQKSLF